MKPQTAAIDANIDNETDLLETIQERLPSLRKSEQKVALVVLADADAALTATLAVMARTAGVSEPTVLRFCEAIGYPRYQTFKMALARSTAFGMHAVHSLITADDPPGQMAGKIFQYTLASLDRARRKLDMASMEKAIEILAAARRIEFFGFGASGIVAQDAQQKFPLFGKPCIATTDYHQQYMSAMTMEPGDALVAISHTGETVAILKGIEAAKERGAKVIGITGREGALSDHCDVVLVVETHENTNVFTPTTSRLAALVVIDILSTGVAMHLDADHVQLFAEMKRSLAQMRRTFVYPESRTQTEPSQDSLAKTAPRWRKARP